MEQSMPGMEAAHEAMQVAGDLPHRTSHGLSGIQVVASWLDFWDEEDGFCYSLGPGRVYSLESFSSAQSMTSFSLDGENVTEEVLSQNVESEGKTIF